MMRMPGEGSFENFREGEREQPADNMVDFLHRIKAERVFGNEEAKREFIKNISFEQFKGWLERVNGILRSVPIGERGFDGKDVALVPNPEQEDKMATAFLGERTPEYPPREEDKEALFAEMFHLVQHMEGEDASLNDIALLVSTGINAIHAFEDGNGRTSRLINYLLTTDYKKSAEQLEFLKKLLGDNGRLFINTDPGQAKDVISDYMFSHRFNIDPEDKNSPKSLTSFSPNHDTEERVKEKVPPEFLQDFQRHIIDESSDDGFFAVYSFLQDKGVLDNFLTRIENQEGTLRRTDLRIVNIVEGLKTKDYPELFDRYWQLKKDRESLLMRAIAEPEKYKMEKSQFPNYSGKTIKENFLSQLDESYLRSFKEVNMENIADIWAEKDRLPFLVDTIPSEEMGKLVVINARLKEFSDQGKRERQLLGFNFEQAEQEFKAAYDEIKTIDTQNWQSQESKEYSRLSEAALKHAYEIKSRIYKPVMDLENRHLEQVVQYLDGLDIWTMKFTTRNEHRSASEEEKEVTDSIYYVTSTGQSLRLRKYGLLKDGLSGSIEPFMEKIFFIDKQYDYSNDQAKVSDEAAEGSFVMEYTTDEFKEAQNGATTKEFTSRIRRYEKDGNITYLNPVDGHKHRGQKIHRFSVLARSGE